MIAVAVAVAEMEIAVEDMLVVTEGLEIIGEDEAVELEIGLLVAELEETGLEAGEDDTEETADEETALVGVPEGELVTGLDSGDELGVEELIAEELKGDEVTLEEAVVLLTGVEVGETAWVLEPTFDDETLELTGLDTGEEVPVTGEEEE